MAKKLDLDIQQLCLSVINHAMKHGDVTLATTLVQALPKGARSNAVKAFIDEYSCMAWQQTSDGQMFVKVPNKKTDMQGAASIMWTEFKPEPEYKPTDLAGAVSKLLSKVQTDIEKGHEHDDKEVNALKELNAALNPSPADAT